MEASTKKKIGGIAGLIGVILIAVASFFLGKDVDVADSVKQGSGYVSEIVNADSADAVPTTTTTTTSSL